MDNYANSMLYAELESMVSPNLTTVDLFSKFYAVSFSAFTVWIW